ncbi:MAG: alpha/beta fold hydrolase [Deltaproteobacteria bacterium]|nr:alpha/beta fold hydrolase [Deltaproteobacteria bacterium]
MRALLLLSLSLLAVGCAHLPEAPPAAGDWERHRLCGPDTRPERRGAARPDYCLEIARVGPALARPRAVALLVPGMFQNGRVFDLWPERGVSFARFLARHGIEPWVFHVRGIGASDYPPRSSLDDIAIDDLPRAIDWLSAHRGRKILVLGHSQGAMTLKASLAGLSRCAEGACFDPEVARARQARVSAAGFFAGSVALTGENLQLRFLAGTGGLLGGLPPLVVDRFPGRRLGLWAHRHLPAALFDALLRRENTPLELREAMLSRTVEATTGKNLAQLSDGLAFGSTRSGAHRWTEALGLITLPVVQVTFEHDPLSPPRATYRDDFRHLGSRQKHFLMTAGQGHGDFQASVKGHDSQLRAVGLLLELGASDQAVW